MNITRRILINSKPDQLSNIVANFNNVINAQLLNSSYKNGKIAISLRKRSPYKFGVTGVLAALLGGLILICFEYSFIITSSDQKFWFWFCLFLPFGLFILAYHYIKKEGVGYNIKVDPMEKKDVYIMEIWGHEGSGQLKSLVQSDIDCLVRFMADKALNLSELPQETFLERMDREGKEAKAQKEAKEKARQDAIEEARRKVGLVQNPSSEISKIRSIDQHQKKLKCKCPNTNCGKIFVVKKDYVGKAARCKYCGTSFVVRAF